MPMSIRIKDKNGKMVPMGQTESETLAFSLAASIGRVQPNAVSIQFSRNLDQADDDPADRVVFELAAGNGQGQVTQTEVEIELQVPETYGLLGTFKVTGACVYSYSESDVGLAVNSVASFRAAELEYTPTAGKAIKFDILANTRDSLSATGKK